MSRIDFFFVMLGAFSYLYIMYDLRDREGRQAKYEELRRKEDQYANQLLEQRRREVMAKAIEAKKQRRKHDLNSMASTMELLSNLSDQEVMRSSRITSGKIARN